MEKEQKVKIIARAVEVKKNGCYNQECEDCILHNVICNIYLLGDTPAEDSKILMTGFLIALNLYY